MTLGTARYTRQVRLTEVGAAGQARISELRVKVAGDDLRARVEAMYLAGAGVAALVVESEGVGEAARGVNPGVEVTSGTGTGRRRGEGVVGELRPGAAEVAEGALYALLTIRAAVLEGAH